MAKAPQQKKTRLGELLTQGKYISEADLQKALTLQKAEGGKLGAILIQQGIIDETRLVTALSEQLMLPVIDLKHYPIKHDIILRVPERIARRYRVILLDSNERENLVGMSDPTDIIASDELRHILFGDIKVAVVGETDLSRIFDLVYRRTEEISSYAAELKEEMGKGEEARVPEAKLISAEAAPVVKLLDSIFEDAVQMGASDIHIEPDEHVIHIRQRIDGVLHEQIVHGKEIISALVLRIKLMSRMNISEKRLPQDGRFAVTVKGHPLDVRVSTMPVYFGESVVMRLLDPTGGILKFEQLGMPAAILERTKYLIHKPHGMFLVTGPTGSGKTTTLYAALSELNSPEKNILTIEDPVEYTLPRINQIQVNPAIDLTFSTVLRSALRQDPDIVMVGEMRDEETVHIGLRAAMTGHLVLSTLHTNDSISCAIRLLDMGAPGFLVGAALRGVLAQRLVRKICLSCIAPYTPTHDEMIWIEGFIGKDKKEYEFKRGKGCSRCNKTGYRGRTGVYELLEITDTLADALRMNDTAPFARLALQAPHFKPLVNSAFDSAVNGITTLSEVLRIAGEG